MVNLQIQETGMLEAFYDFCENLDEEMFYSFEEAEQIVEEKMKAGWSSLFSHLKCEFETKEQADVRSSSTPSTSQSQ